MISNELNQYHGDPETALDGLAAASRILLDMAELGELRDREAGREDFPASTTTAALWHLSGMVGDAWAVLTDAGARELPRVEL